MQQIKFGLELITSLIIAASVLLSLNALKWYLFGFLKKARIIGMLSLVVFLIGILYLYLARILIP